MISLWKILRHCYCTRQTGAQEAQFSKMIEENHKPHTDVRWKFFSHKNLIICYFYNWRFLVEDFQPCQPAVNFLKTPSRSSREIWHYLKTEIVLHNILDYSLVTNKWFFYIEKILEDNLKNDDNLVKRHFAAYSVYVENKSILTVLLLFSMKRWIHSNTTTSNGRHNELPK